MKLMLTSFGIGESEATSSGDDNLFYRMPPVSFREFSESFTPDYDLLVLCDQIVMDGESFGRLLYRPHIAYSGVAKTFGALRSEGRIELVDFTATLRANEKLLENMLDHDLKILDQWVEPLRQSLDTWQLLWDAISNGILIEHLSSFHANNIRGVLCALHDGKSFMQNVQLALGSSEKRKHKAYRHALRQVIVSYLRYVNSNLVLANEFQIPFHDWLDFMPFYSAKFLSVGRADGAPEQKRKQVEKLFTLAFPQYAINDTQALVKLINDKRIVELRKLITDAAAGKVEFDQKFANAVLMEVHKTHEKTARFRKVLGYLTLPIELVPVVGIPLMKATEELTERVMERKARAKHQWFYMLSEIAESKDSAHETP